MSLKVCGNCTTAYAHSLEECPNCQASQFVMQHELPDNYRELIEQGQLNVTKDSDTVHVSVVEDTAFNPTGTDHGPGEEAPNEESPGVDDSAPVPQRPKDSASAAEWKAYARAVSTNTDEENERIESLTRGELIRFYG